MSASFYVGVQLEKEMKAFCSNTRLPAAVIFWHPVHFPPPRRRRRGIVVLCPFFFQCLSRLLYYMIIVQ